MSFPQPIVDKSLVNYDIRGARPNFIEKEIKLLERENKSFPAPQKLNSDYVVNTRFGANPYFQKSKQPDFQVSLPQGIYSFDEGGRKHYRSQIGEINQQRSLENPYNLPSSLEPQMPYYPRSLNVKDIDGAVPNTLISKAVINKENAKKAIQQDARQEETLQNRDPYQAYQDALDKFKSDVNGGGANIFKDRHLQGNINIQNPYAPVNDPRYQPTQNRKSDVNGGDDQYRGKNVEFSQDLPPQQKQYENQAPQRNPSLPPQRFPEQKQQTNNLHSLNQQGQYSNQDNQYQNEYQEQEQSKIQQYQQQQQKNAYQQQPQNNQQREQQAQQTQKYETISHSINNGYPQAAKQQISVPLNVDGYVANKYGPRINPTSMSYGAEAVIKSNQPISPAQITQSYLQQNPTRYPHARDGRVNGYQISPQNLKNYEKIQLEIQAPKDINKQAPKDVTKQAINTSIFRAPQRALPPKCEMASLLKNTQTCYQPDERNLDHFKRDDYGKVATQNDFRSTNLSSSIPRAESKLAANPLPFGAPFSYNPNEFRKQGVVSLNHQKQLEKIERSIEVNDHNVDAIQYSVPEIQQPHIKRTLNSSYYPQDLNTSANLRQQYDQNQNVSGLGNRYGDENPQYQQRNANEDSQKQSEQFLAKYGAKALRNQSNVKIF